MKSYEVRFSEEALRDLGTIFTELLPVAGERVARNFVGRIEATCLELGTFPERGSVRHHVRPGLRLIGYRRQVSIAFVVANSQVLILRIFRRGVDTEAVLASGGSEAPDT